MRLLFVLLTFFGWVTSLRAQPSQAAELQKADDLGASERRLRSVHEKVGPAIVRIVQVNDEGHEWHFASGVIVTADGHVVTRSSPYQPIPEGTPLAFHLADGRRVTGTALGWSGEWQIGLAKIGEQGPWPHVKLGKAAEVKVRNVSY